MRRKYYEREKVRVANVKRGNILCPSKCTLVCSFKFDEASKADFCPSVRKLRTSGRIPAATVWRVIKGHRDRVEGKGTYGNRERAHLRQCTGDDRSGNCSNQEDAARKGEEGGSERTYKFNSDPSTADAIPFQTRAHRQRKHIPPPSLSSSVHKTFEFELNAPMGPR